MCGSICGDVMNCLVCYCIVVDLGDTNIYSLNKTIIAKQITAVCV